MVWLHSPYSNRISQKLINFLYWAFHVNQITCEKVLRHTFLTKMKACV